ncbi:transcriptional repressor CTCFL isoform X2 [Babesia caballi]|uniref:Transcriptional repressor CTCFL isoform X2 n=1 Tax=Babesia caballi TaxID=5871 RepID=A0AAV4LRF5_BABCB|nr:transcriptional repressor CTCFL isoform X2 [Babesia caballi]
MATQQKHLPLAPRGDADGREGQRERRLRRQRGAAVPHQQDGEQPQGHLQPDGRAGGGPGAGERAHHTVDDAASLQVLQEAVRRADWARQLPLLRLRAHRLRGRPVRRVENRVHRRALVALRQAHAAANLVCGALHRVYTDGDAHAPDQAGEPLPQGEPHLRRRRKPSAEGRGKTDSVSIKVVGKTGRRPNGG